LDAGDAQHIVDQIIERISKIKGGKTDQWVLQLIK
jgi:hypothetical protein